MDKRILKLWIIGGSLIGVGIFVSEIYKDYYFLNRSTSRLSVEIDELKNKRYALEEENTVLKEKLDDLEMQVYSKEHEENELNQMKELLGINDISGAGIEVIIEKKSFLEIGENAENISEKEIVHLINLFKFSGAKAISINGIRVTHQTGVKLAGDFLWVGDNERISLVENIIFKLIGDINSLKQGINFHGEMEVGSLSNYNYTIIDYSNMLIEKSSKPLSYDFVR